MSYLVRTIRPMEIDRNVFTCNWCGTTFPRRHWTGRKPHYCTVTCRQRAYEDRRRGAHRADLPARWVAPDHRQSPRRYEVGHTRRRAHALRPFGPIDRHGRRTTLCGAAAYTTRLRFVATDPRRPLRCQTCVRIERDFPPDRHVDPPIDIAVAGGLVQSLRWAHRHAPAEDLHRSVGDLLAFFPPQPLSKALRAYAAGP